MTNYERSFLAGVLSFTDRTVENLYLQTEIAQIAALVSPVDFSTSIGEKIFSAVLTLCSEGRAIALPHIAKQLTEDAPLFRYHGGIDAFLVTLQSEGLPEIHLVCDFARQVRQDARTRKAKTLQSRLARALTTDSLGEAADLAKEISKLLKEKGEIQKRIVSDEERLARLERDGAGRVRRTLTNVVMILTYDPFWSDVFSYNVARGKIEMRRLPEWQDEITGTSSLDWTEVDDARLQVWLEKVYKISVSKEHTSSAVRIVAERSHRYHPVQEYLLGLTWDNVPRLSSLFEHYFGVAPSAYVQAISRWWPISAVARVLSPGCKADCMPVIEGKQGSGKSRALEILAVRREWFCDSPVPIGEKDGQQVLRGKWIIEFGEMDSWTKADRNRAKAFLSSTTDSYRPSYGRHTVDIPRSNVFVGTTNEKQYIDDPTGARRIWPLCRGTILHEELARDRDQIWAEAVAAYQGKERWWPDSEAEFDFCAAEQAKRQRVDPWQERISAWLQMTTLDVTIANVLEFALHLEVHRWTRADEMRVGHILQALDYERSVRKTKEGRREWIYAKL